MAGRKQASDGAAKMPSAQAKAEAPDRTKLTDMQLAKAVLAGTVRPRVGEVRRLAEALLKKDAPKPAKKGKGKGKKAKSGKLAKIPRQKK